MYKFLLFLKKIQFLLLFVVIEGFAVKYYSDSSSYNQAKMINVSNYMVGDIYAAMSHVGRYFTMRRENTALVQEVARLRGELEQYRASGQPSAELVDSLLDSAKYTYTTARVVNNSVSRQENFLTLNKGENNGVTPDMAIVISGAVAGYTLQCSDRFAVGMSVLNTKFKTSGRIKGQDYFGPIYWDGHNRTELILTEIPKYAKMNEGDTIVTTQYSSIFPPDLLIGTIANYELINGTYYQARIKLFADMSSLNNVVLVKYKDFEEKRALEEPVAGDVSRN